MPSTISADELREMREAYRQHALIDVREKGEFVEQHIFRAVPIPRGLLELRMPSRVPDRHTPVILYDDDGHRAQLAAGRLEEMDYSDVRLLEGGIDAWKGIGGRTDYGTNVPGKDYGEKIAVQKKTPHLTPDELLRRQAAGEKILILDSRTQEEFERSHVPGAVNIPGGELARRVPTLLQDPANKDATLVVNCAGRTRSILGADVLLKMQLDNPIYALENGTAAWTLSGHELERGPGGEVSVANDDQSVAKSAALAERVAREDGVKTLSIADLDELMASDGNFYIVDVRLPQEYEEGHVPGSVSLPAGQLALAADEIIAVNQAPVVLISNQGHRASIGGSLLRQMDYPNVFTLSGGLDAWRSEGRDLEQGSPEPEIYGLTEAVASTTSIDPARLRDLLASGKPVTIIDVKGPGDYALAHIENSLWIARGDLERKISTLVQDKDRAIVLTCDSGVRSALAAATLAELGYTDVRWLAGGLDAWSADGGQLVEGLDGADVPLKLAKEDVEMIGRRGPLARNRQDMIDYLDWEIELGHKYEIGQ